MNLSNSPTTEHIFNGNTFYLKRDDQLHSQFSGNKARKFMSLLNGEFAGVDTLIGYGSVQANSLFSLSVLCAIKGWKLKFFVDHIPSYVESRPMGNYRGALELGAEVVNLSKQPDRDGLHAQEYIARHYGHSARYLIVPEGGRCLLAEEGVKGLAEEIIDWKKLQRLDKLTVALPSGTGTTALFLNKYLALEQIEVITCACVGGTSYLVEQFNELDPNAPHPKICEINEKHYFGRLYKENYLIWQALQQQTHVEFELLYDPLMWRCLQQWFVENKNSPLLYIHQGGTMGNETMLPRYLRAIEKGEL